MSQGAESTHPGYGGWLRGTLIFLALLVIVRFVLEIAGAPRTTTRYFSSSAAVFLAAIYLGAVAPLRGVRRFAQLILPALALTAWTGGWVILFTLVSGAFRLQRSHFAERADYGNWGNLGHHIFEHAVEIPILAVLALILMAVPFVLRRWPVTVGPVTLLGALVIIRYTAEAMGVAPVAAAAWSSTVGVLVCGFYLGGVGSRLGLTSAWQLFVPAIVVAWAWRFWVFLAAVLSAAVPFYRTHFFDPSRGRVIVRLAQLLGGSVVEGFVVGLLLWGIAAWIFRATRPEPLSH